jgi:hypothetical protein
MKSVNLQNLRHVLRTSIEKVLARPTNSGINYHVTTLIYEKFVRISHSARDLIELEIQARHELCQQIRAHKL